MSLGHGDHPLATIRVVARDVGSPPQLTAGRTQPLSRRPPLQAPPVGFFWQFCH